jgi:tRNA-intron endonuclease
LKQPKQTSSSPSDTEAKITNAVLREKEILVCVSESIEELAARGYGAKQNKTLALTFYEALFLINRGILEVQDEKTSGKVDFQQVLSYYKSVDANAWAKYLIYRDLRSRGYVTREGFGSGIDFRVYERGEYGIATAKYLVYGIQEGQPVSIEDLAQTLRYVHSQKKQLVLAVLNRRGEVVYYSLSRLTLKKANMNELQVDQG